MVSLTETCSFALTSAPEDSHLSIHFRCTDAFTKAFANALDTSASSNAEAPWTLEDAKSSQVENVDSECSDSDIPRTVQKVFPQVLLSNDSAPKSENIFFYDVAVLVGAGECVMPYASILKSIWYRMNNPRAVINLQKVYFIWVCHEFESYEWFRSILLAIEYQDLDGLIEIYPVSTF